LQHVHNYQTYQQIPQRYSIGTANCRKPIRVFSWAPAALAPYRSAQSMASNTLPAGMTSGNSSLVPYDTSPHPTSSVQACRFAPCIVLHDSRSA